MSQISSYLWIMTSLEIIFIIISSIAVTDNWGYRIKRVIGGNPVDRTRWPFMVSLHYSDHHPYQDPMGLPHLCGGTLLTPDIVLSAAHCFQNADYPRLSEERYWTVVIGDYHRGEDEGTEQRIAVTTITKHEEFTLLPTKNDIALLKLAYPVEMNEFSSLVHLCTGTQNNRNRVCKVIGWGQQVHANYGMGTYVPHEADLSFVDISTCSVLYETSQYSQYFDIDNNVICASGQNGSKTLDSCMGDSGGPLMCMNNGTWEQVGIVSGGVGCGQPEFPGLYTNLYMQREWIADKMQELND